VTHSATLSPSPGTPGEGWGGGCVFKLTTKRQFVAERDSGQKRVGVRLRVRVGSCSEAQPDARPNLNPTHNLTRLFSFPRVNTRFTPTKKNTPEASGLRGVRASQVSKALHAAGREGPPPHAIPSACRPVPELKSIGKEEIRFTPTARKYSAINCHIAPDKRLEVPAKAANKPDQFPGFPSPRMLTSRGLRLSFPHMLPRLSLIIVPIIIPQHRG
jgi:hypothetical protein